MMMIPIVTPGHAEDCVIIVLGDRSLERMARADPFDVDLNKAMSRTGGKLVNPKIVVCHEKDTPEFRAVMTGGDLGQIVAFLSRGFEFRPDLGDNTQGPRPVPEGWRDGK